jgi:hypothetical protein
LGVVDLKSANHTGIEQESLKFFIPLSAIPFFFVSPYETAKSIT